MNKYFWIGLFLIIADLIIGLPNWIKAIANLKTSPAFEIGELLVYSIILIIGVVLLIVGIKKARA